MKRREDLEVRASREIGGDFRDNLDHLCCQVPRILNVGLSRYHGR
jgi:hypothetical protein